MKKTIIILFISLMLSACTNSENKTDVQDTGKYTNLKYMGMYKVLGTAGQFATFKNNENQNVAVIVDPRKNFDLRVNKEYNITVSESSWTTHEGFLTSATESK